MIVLLSPSKRMRHTIDVVVKPLNFPMFLDKSNEIIEILRTYNVKELAQLMNVSLSIAQQAFQMYAMWNKMHGYDNTLPAICAYSGDVYDGFNVLTIKSEQWEYIHHHIYILSGLYGILRGMDGIMPYRLEVGLQWSTEKFENLYEYWKDDVLQFLRGHLQTSKYQVLINLASNEYWKMVNVRQLSVPVVTPEFYEWKGGKKQMVSIYAKRARGLMARFIVEHQPEDVEILKAFDWEGYHFDASESNENRLIFVRSSR